MLKNVTLLLLLALLPFFSATAQNVPNGGFEDWENLAGGIYAEPTGWASLNILALIAAPQTITQSGDAAQGSFAAKLETKSFFGNLIPGLLYLGDFDIALGLNGVKPGVPFAGGRPDKFTGVYKYSPVAGDSAVVFAQLWRFNPQTNKRDTIAEAAAAFNGAVNTYTPFELDFTYYSTLQPDTVYVVLVSSGAGASGQGQVGSTLFVDDVAFEYNTGVSLPLMGNAAGAKVMHQPASGSLTVTLEKPLYEAQIELYSMQGQSVLKEPLPHTQHTFNVAVLPPGNYVYRIYAAGMPVKNGRVQVVK